MSIQCSEADVTLSLAFPPIAMNSLLTMHTCHSPSPHATHRAHTLHLLWGHAPCTAPGHVSRAFGQPLLLHLPCLPGGHLHIQSGARKGGPQRLRQAAVHPDVEAAAAANASSTVIPRDVTVAASVGAARCCLVSESAGKANAHLQQGGSRNQTSPQLGGSQRKCKRQKRWILQR